MQLVVKHVGLERVAPTFGSLCSETPAYALSFEIEASHLKFDTGGLNTLSQVCCLHGHASRLENFPRCRGAVLRRRGSARADPYDTFCTSRMSAFATRAILSMIGGRPGGGQCTVWPKYFRKKHYGVRRQCPPTSGSATRTPANDSDGLRGGASQQRHA